MSADYEGPEYQWTAGVNSGHGVLRTVIAENTMGQRLPDAPTYLNARLAGQPAPSSC